MYSGYSNSYLAHAKRMSVNFSSTNNLYAISTSAFDFYVDLIEYGSGTDFDSWNQLDSIHLALLAAAIHGEI